MRCGLIRARETHTDHITDSEDRNGIVPVAKGRAYYMSERECTLL